MVDFPACGMSDDTGEADPPSRPSCQKLGVQLSELLKTHLVDFDHTYWAYRLTGYNKQGKLGDMLVLK